MLVMAVPATRPSVMYHWTAVTLSRTSLEHGFRVLLEPDNQQINMCSCGGAGVVASLLCVGLA